MASIGSALFGAAGFWLLFVWPFWKLAAHARPRDLLLWLALSLTMVLGMWATTHFRHGRGPLALVVAVLLGSVAAWCAGQGAYWAVGAIGAMVIGLGATEGRL